ncbi:hypothetical protein AVEN_35969-1 [Araneus ventricosus]|uniref:Uncharacterized protein n=1 Tax=Araneus ventricosus TaxID=182803 RepID=A0A4Y2UBA5_ARAVE|nr:hypothetical protein AVEN_35969-1 [Araneus ventricosus]
MFEVPMKKVVWCYKIFQSCLDGDLLQQIDWKLDDFALSDDVKFSESNAQIIVTLRSNVNIKFKRNSGPRLMNVLNIIDDAYVIRGKQSILQFPYSQSIGSINDEAVHVTVYKVFPTTRKDTETSTFIIQSGMYQQAKYLFEELKFIVLRLTADSRLGLHVL